MLAQLCSMCSPSRSSPWAAPYQLWLSAISPTFPHRPSTQATTGHPAMMRHLAHTQRPLAPTGRPSQPILRPGPPMHPSPATVHQRPATLRPRLATAPQAAPMARPPPLMHPARLSVRLLPPMVHPLLPMVLPLHPMEHHLVRPFLPAAAPPTSHPSSLASPIKPVLSTSTARHCGPRAKEESTSATACPCLSVRPIR
jgi:hypothetical protein